MQGYKITSILAMATFSRSASRASQSRLRLSEHNVKLHSSIVEREQARRSQGLYAQSRKDFISKLNIALKEAGETDYWLDVIHSAGYFTDQEFDSLNRRTK